MLKDFRRFALLAVLIFGHLIGLSANLANSAVGTNSSTVTNLTTGISGVSGVAFKDIATNSSGNIVVAVANSSDIFISVDTGTTWSNKTTGTSLSGLTWRSVAISDNGQIIYAAVYGGDIYKSSDTGNTWTAVTLTTGHNKNWTGVTTSSDGLIVYAVAQSDYFYYSTNGGSTWVKPSPYPVGYTSSWPFTGVSTDNQGSLALTTSNFGSTFASFSSSINAGLLESSALYFNDVAVSGDGKRAYTTSSLYSSDQYGFNTFVQFPEFNKYTQVVATTCYLQTCAGGMAVGTNNDGRLTIHGKSSSQLFISTDSGFSFSTLTNSPTANWQSISVNSAGDIAFAAVASGDIYKISIDISTLKYSIIYNGDGGIGCTQQSAPSNGVVTLTSASACTKSSNTLKYWRINGVNYSPGATFALTEQANAIAIWTPRVTLTYSSNFSNSGTAPAAITVDSGTVISLSANSGNLKKTNLGFNGWNTLANGLGTRYSPGDSFTVTATSTIYAMWSANVATSLSISEITVPVIYRTALSVQATVEQPGKITFFSNGKRIPGCVSRSITTTYICSYRPSVHGANIVTASLVPTDSGYARVTSAPKNLGAASRTTTR